HAFEIQRTASWANKGLHFLHLLSMAALAKASAICANSVKPNSSPLTVGGMPACWSSSVISSLDQRRKKPLKAFTRVLRRCPPAARTPWKHSLSSRGAAAGVSRTASFTTTEDTSGTGRKAPGGALHTTEGSV